MSTEIKVKSLSPLQSWQKLQEDSHTLLIDVRSSMEFLFIGHPVGAVNIAWIDEPDWEINPNFAEDIRRHVMDRKPAEMAAEDVPLLLICRSGVRSLEAGEVLIKAGFKEIFNVLEGFEGPIDDEKHRGTRGGWRFHKLPWEQC